MKNITNQKQNLINPRQDLQGFKNLEGLKQGLNAILLAITILLFTPTTTQAQEETPEWQWMQSMGGAFQLGTVNTYQYDYVRDMKADKWGNIYMTGNFVRDMTIQDTVLEAPFNGPNNNNLDLFIAKFNCEGDLEWAKRGGGQTNFDDGRIVLIGEDNIFFVGNGRGQSVINNQPFTLDQYSAYNFGGMVLARMDADGEIDVFKVAHDIRVQDKCGVLDEEENMYLIIYVASETDYDGVEFDPGFYLLKVDSNFNYLHHEFIADFVSASDIEFNTIKLDSEGSILIGGAVKNEGIEIYGFNTNVYGSETFFLLKIDHLYNPLWMKQPECVVNQNGASNSKLFDVVLDKKDNIYISSFARSYGYFAATWLGCWFEQDTIFNFNHNRGIRAVFIKYNAEGNQEWVNFVEGENDSSVEFPENMKLYMDETSHTLYTYATSPEGLLQYDTFSTIITGRGMYVMQIDTNGAFVDINLIQTNPSAVGGFGGYMGTQFDLMNNGNYYIGGVHYDYIHFPDSILVPLWGSGSNRDIYLAKYGTTECYRCDSIIVNFEVQPNNLELLITANNTLFAETYLWDFGNGTQSNQALPPAVQYADTGTYEVCLTATSFCDSATFCKEVLIGCPPPSITSFSLVAEELNLSVENTAVDNYEQLTWSWGDGNTTIDELNPMYQYADTGTYEVCLVATNSCGIDSLCETISITLEEELPTDTTSIITLENGGKVMAYPNPMESTLVLKIDNKSMAKNYEYKILDALGKVVVKSSPINQANESIKVSHLSSGIYFLHIYNQKESHSVHLMKE